MVLWPSGVPRDDLAHRVFPVALPHLEAEEVEPGGVAVVPSFSPDSKGTDWNDLAQEKGLGVVSLQYTAALNAGREKQQSQAQSRPQSQQQSQSQPAANDEQVKRRGVSR